MEVTNSCLIGLRPLNIRDIIPGANQIMDLGAEPSRMNKQVIAVSESSENPLNLPQMSGFWYYFYH